LTPGELHALYAAAGSIRTLSLIRVAAEGGLRRAELIGLRWSDVDLEGSRITVRRSIWQERVRHGTKIVKSTKGRENRHVPISGDLTGLLADWFALSVVELGADASGPVWPGRDGGWLSADSPTQTLERAMTRAGLVDADDRPLVDLHGLRHGCGSLMLMADVPLIAVSRFLGHANVQITANVYSHLVSSETQLRGASDALTGLLRTQKLRGELREPKNDLENDFV